MGVVFQNFPIAYIFYITNTWRHCNRLLIPTEHSLKFNWRIEFKDELSEHYRNLILKCLRSEDRDAPQNAAVLAKDLIVLVNLCSLDKAIPLQGQ